MGECEDLGRAAAFGWSEREFVDGSGNGGSKTRQLSKRVNRKVVNMHRWEDEVVNNEL
jgi:hypothetical protein